MKYDLSTQQWGFSVTLVDNSEITEEPDSGISWLKLCFMEMCLTPEDYIVWRRSVRTIIGKFVRRWLESWSANTLATWYEELTPWKRPWCWERLKAGGEGDDRGWDGWMPSPSQCTWVWVSSESWWWTGKPGVLQSMGLQRVRHNWANELNWLDMCVAYNRKVGRMHLGSHEDGGFGNRKEEMNNK